MTLITINVIMESQTNFYSYRAGEVPLIKRIENENNDDDEVLGFKDSVPVIVSKQKPQSKTLTLKTDTTTGKTFIVVNGKKVEVMKVKKSVERALKKQPPQPSMVMRVANLKTNKSGPSSVVLKKTKDIQTSTDGLVETTSVAVQTNDEEEIIVSSKDEGGFEDFKSNYITGKDVIMGNGPKCPKILSNFKLTLSSEPFPVNKVIHLTPQMELPRPITRKEQILQLIKHDYSQCLNFDISGNM